MAEPLLTDLFFTRRAVGRQASNRMAVDLGEARGDVRLVRGRNNLAQALLNRLLTRRGELTLLGHPNYGSRLHELLGEPNNTMTRARAELYIRECLGAERRVAEIIDIAFELPERRRDTRYVLDITITVQPAADDTPLTLSVTVNL